MTGENCIKRNLLQVVVLWAVAPCNEDGANKVLRNQRITRGHNLEDHDMNFIAMKTSNLA
jgi:hypothetical protein